MNNAQRRPLFGLPRVGRLARGCGFLLLLLVGAARAELNFQYNLLNDAYYLYERDVGDIDGDGRNDIVGVQEGDTTVQVFRAPTWTRSTLISLTAPYLYPRADDFKLADINGDGKLDVVMRLGTGPFDEGPGIAAWYENLGGGSNFTQHVIDQSPDYVKDIVVADFDRDGRLDVAMRMESETQLWLQEADGTWTEVLLNHFGHEGMEAGDLNGDGIPDIILNGFWFETPKTPAEARVAANYTFHIIDGIWFDQVDQGDGAVDSCKVVVGDFDGDGTNDVAFSHSERPGYEVAWYRSDNPNGAGHWTKHLVTPVDYCHNLQAADFNLDGKVDLLVGGMLQSEQRGLKLMLNQGGGTNWSEFMIQTNGSYSAELGDLDNDGDLDIVGIRNWDQAPSWFYRNNASGPPSLDFWFYHQVSDQQERTFSLCFPDVNGDGKRDIASGPFVYLNPGSGMTGVWNQVALPDSILGSVHAFATLDVDGDNLTDLIAQQDNSGANRIDVYWVEAANAAGTSWAAPIRVGDVPRATGFAHLEGFQGYAVAQINAGGRPEIIVNSPQGLYYYSVPTSNPGAGNWPRTFVAENNSEEGIDVADLDGDGDLDISFTHGDPHEVKWARNPGDGSGNWDVFVIGTFPEAGWPDRCALADLNGDGRVDIIVTAENLGTAPDALACWWEQPASGATSPGWVRHTITTQYTMNSMDVGDVDQDGDMDVVLAEHRGPRRLAVWANDGAGNFTEHRVDEGKESHLGARLVDLDGDGDLDLVSIAYDTSNELHLWRNDSPRERPPAIDSVTAVNAITVRVRFNEPVETFSAQALTNYAINNGVTIANALLGTDTRTVTLSTSPLSGSIYTLTVNHVADLGSPPRTIATDSQATFIFVPDTIPPTIASVTATNPNLVHVVFSEAVEALSAQTVAHYAINHGVTIAGAVLSADSRTVTLTTSTLVGGYTLTVNDVTDVAVPANAITPNTQTNFTFTTDAIPPTITSVTAVNPTTVQVLFSEPVDALWAQNPAGYTIDNGVAVTWALLGADTRTVTLITRPLLSGEHSLTVNGVTDRAQPPNPIAPNSLAQFSFTPISPRVTAGLVALYGFEEVAGTTVHDVSGVGAPLDLAILDSAKIQWVGGGAKGVRFTSSGSAIRSPGAATKIRTALTATNRLTLEAWVTPANLTQNGPARIATISQGTSTGDVNLHLGQEFGSASYRLRTTSTVNSFSALQAGGAFTSTVNPRHLAVTYDGTAQRLYVDGVQHATVQQVSGSLANWNAAYPLVLGNEATLDRSWLGTLHLVAVYDRALSLAQIQQNHDAGHRLTAADTAPPTMMTVAADNATTVRVLFSEPVAMASAQTPSNYSINAAGSILSAVLDADTRTVTLTTSTLLSNVTYTLTVNNVTDVTTPPNVIAPNSQLTFALPVQTPSILAIQKNGDGTVTLRFGGIPGQQYIVQAARDLRPAITWENVSTNSAGTDGQLTFTDSLTNQSKRFYRVVLP